MILSQIDEAHPLHRIRNGIDAVRLRPAMFVGSTDFFGIIHYLVCPVALLLEQRPAGIAIFAENGGFRIESDVVLPLAETADGRLAPFEDITSQPQGLGFEGTVLNALSESLSIEIRNDDQCETLVYRRGERVGREHKQVSPDGCRTTMRFAPDTTIFTFTAVSSYIFTSYLRRLSFLHPGVRFTLTIGGRSQ